MTFFIANPWGFLALLGIPVVVAIHLLQRRSRQVVVSTLFLVERTLPSSEGGRRVRMLRNSLPLWVQVLTVAALAWLLAQPRWIDLSSTQTVVTVMDSSASLSAFRKEVMDSVSRELHRLEAAAARTQWIVLRSDASRLASGSDLGETLAEVEKSWHPAFGTHDTTEALRLARTLAGPSGTVLYFSDHLPPAGQTGDVPWFARGEPLENAGFLGAQADTTGWSALLKNFGSARRSVRWRLAGEEAWKSEDLEPGALTEISGSWPDGADRLTLETEGDRFPLDDRLPVIRPVEKILHLKTEPTESFLPLFSRLARLAEPARPAEAGPADVFLSVYSPLRPRTPDGPALIFVEDAGGGHKPLTAPVVPENHPLMENLNWQGLRVRDTLGLPFREGDSALLWQGDRPLIFLRSVGNVRQLVFNFDVRHSNASRLPAFALLVHRFFSLLREEKIAPSAANVETGQTVALAGAGPVVAPHRPEFFSIPAADGTPLFEGAAQFSDSRESDFRAAAHGQTRDITLAAVRSRHARGEFLDPLWVLILAALMLWNWLLTGAPARQDPLRHPQAA